MRPFCLKFVFYRILYEDMDIFQDISVRISRSQVIFSHLSLDMRRKEKHQFELTPRVCRLTNNISGSIQNISIVDPFHLHFLVLFYYHESILFERKFRTICFFTYTGNDLTLRII